MQMIIKYLIVSDPDLIKDPFFLRPAGIVAVVIAVLLLLVISLLIFCWVLKSRRRKQEYFERKTSLRESLRSLRLERPADHQHMDGRGRARLSGSIR